MTELENLTEEEKTALGKEIVDSLYSRGWCAINGVDYVRPDYSLVTKIVYKDGFWKNRIGEN